MRPSLTIAPTFAVVAAVLTIAAGQQGPATPPCQAKLVHCNYGYLYSGTIQVFSVDSVSTNDHVVRYVTDMNINVSNGVATCSGTRTEFERLGYNGTFHSEIKGNGAIAGSGLLAVEFDFAEGKAVYRLTLACPVPRMTKTSTNLKTGKSETETFPGSPAEWREAGLAADPQPSTGPGMTPLTGRQDDIRSEPENGAGGKTRTVWELRRL